MLESYLEQYNWYQCYHVAIACRGHNCANGYDRESQTSYWCPALQVKSYLWSRSQFFVHWIKHESTEPIGCVKPVTSGLSCLKCPAGISTLMLLVWPLNMSAIINVTCVFDINRWHQWHCLECYIKVHCCRSNNHLGGTVACHVNNAT